MGSDQDTTALSDAALARRITDGDSGAGAAEGELYRRFAPRVRLYGLRHLGSEDAAADLSQRVVTLAIEKLRTGQVREPERIASFVLGTARMITREIRRDRRRASPSDALPDVEDLSYRPPEPLASEHLARCLEVLAERERAVVVLTYFGDRSAGEIASSLALSEGNVRVIRHRSIAQLRDCMGLEP